MYRGQCDGNAFTIDDSQCPSGTGATWIYGNSWLGAGEGLLLSCYNSTCSQGSPCPHGEGDCDDDFDCGGSLVCGTDNCESGPRGLDCCTSTCHNDSDCSQSRECNAVNNQCYLWPECSQASPCADGEGDCDHHMDCEGTLLCGNDNCASGPSGMDCCTDDGI